jgi:DNA-binding response OmpR family regulator
MSQTQVHQNSTTSRPPRVLVIEDDADTLALMAVVMSRLGIDSVPAACEAGRYAARQLGTPDLVICDANLPDGNGVDCAAELKRAHGCGTLIISGEGPPVRRDGGLPAGIDVWLTKPIQLDVLRETLGRILHAGH